MRSHRSYSDRSERLPFVAAVYREFAARPRAEPQYTYRLTADLP